MINKSKSSIYFSTRTSPAITREIRSILGLGSHSRNLKYLDLPLVQSKNNRTFFEEVKENIQGKLTSWKAKLLSQAGRTTLIRTIDRSVDKSLMRFWWDFDTKKSHNFTPKSWNSIYKPKSMRGLGVRLTYNFNRALLSKLGWSLLQPALGLWKTILSSIYLKTHSWWNVPIKKMTQGLGRIWPNKEIFLETAIATWLTTGPTHLFGKIFGFPQLFLGSPLPHLMTSSRTQIWKSRSLH